MAIRVPFIGKTNSRGQANPPYAGSAPTQDQAPFDQLVGHTPQEPDAGTIRPRAGMPPLGQSGRANFYGLPEIDEVNPKLAGITGLRMFDEMYRTDAHVRRLILAAWSPITAGTWTLEPYGGEDASDKDRNIAETVSWMLNEWMTPNFTEHLHTLGPMLLRFGFVPFEQLWAPCKHDGKTLLAPRKLDPRLPRTIWRWWQDDWGELTHIGQILPNRPDVVMPATEVTYYRLGGEGDNWQGTSLLRHAYKHWFIKDRLERIDMIGQERKAVGVPIVYHTTDVDPQAVSDLENAVANMHTSEVAYLMVPGRKMGTSGAQGIAGTKEFLVDVIQFDSSSGDSIKESIEYHQTAISASFLTDFLELGHHQVGARATAEVQQDPFLTAINGALLPPLMGPLNELVARIVQVNWGDTDGSPTWQVTLHDDASLTEISSYVQQLAMAGAINVDEDLEDWLRERGGLPPANQDARAQKDQLDQAQQEAQLAGANASAQDPQGLKAQAVAAKAAAAAKPAPAKSTPTNTPTNTPAKPTSSKTLDASAPVAAGLIVQADDTGRVLLVQRSDDKHDDDDTRARWEFPGGKTDDDDASLYDTGVREWGEETGATLPKTAKQVGSFTTPDGKYRAYGIRIPHEADVNLAPDSDEVADIGWWDPAELASDHRVRGKVQEALPDIHRLLKPSKQQLNSPWSMMLRLLDANNPADPADRRVVSDFDGCIRDKDTGNPIRDPVTGLTAADVLPRIAKEYEVVICTANPNLPEVRGWLRAHGLGQFADKVTNIKPAANAYIDDNGIEFTTWAAMPEKVVSQIRRGRHPVQPKNLEDAGGGGFAPMSGGTGSEDGLQMVPDVCSTCKRKLEDGACPECGPNPKKPAGKAGKHLDAEPSSRWFDRLLSQDHLREAFDGCRDHIEAAVGPAALTAARKMAHQAANGTPVTTSQPPAELVDALSQHYAGMYQLGQQTVQAELARQRANLGKQLDDPAATITGVAAGSRLGRARQRGEHSAQNIVNKVSEILGRQQISGLKSPAALQTAAEQAATGQLRVEALTNTASMVNDGRNDAGTTASDVTGAIYTSVMDERSCDACIVADTGDVLSPEDAVGLGPPNPDCAGGHFCRCTLVWVLSNDPAAAG